MAIAALASPQVKPAAADKLMYFTGVNTMALVDFGANARATLANAKAWITSLFGLTMTADKLPYGTGANTMGLTDFTAHARTRLLTLIVYLPFAALSKLTNF